ncbi:hypothetical protein [Pelagovum pacificum]|uniref:Uncharacterized protein n=1 Tax=Pelagovum pacificum TaxID=2588711 RepID=A0A5C5GBD6_9RHOB|nr:hypothetical protein [Pelagovum pacificum]QQA42198.1 hypothetical protein I8N54_15575 [Pelagovum pacificum]TNY31284.1 hypothetical protein FHY64_14760 [Pelagovum pacificum]
MDTSLLSGGILIPAIVLAAIGWVVPRLLAIVFPEGVKPLLLLAFASTCIMVALGMIFFLLLYILQGLSLSEVFSLGVREGLVHFARLGLASALLWGPIMILSVAGLPKHWVEETW